jgi:hypothetical protein
VVHPYLRGVDVAVVDQKNNLVLVYKHIYILPLLVDGSRARLENEFCPSRKNHRNVDTVLLLLVQKLQIILLPLFLLPPCSSICVLFYSVPQLVKFFGIQECKLGKQEQKAQQ